MFLANENFPRPSILLLRDNGFEITSIQENFQSITDSQVLQIAKEKDLIILTFDKDYGELIFRYLNESPPSVVYYRYKGLNPLYAGEVLLEILRDGQIKLKNAFTVIDNKGIRQRFYPK